MIFTKQFGRYWMSQSTEIITKMLENLALYILHGTTDATLYDSVDNIPSFRENETELTTGSGVVFFNVSAPGAIFGLDISGPQVWNILFERYAQPFVEVEERQDIRFARISLYEDAENTNETVNDGRAHFSEQTYGLDISVVRAYSKDNETRGECPYLPCAIRLLIGLKIVNTQVLTNSYIYTFTYTGASPIVRDDRYVSRTLTFTARRDLYKPQNT
jgi:hypothetical protein